MQIKNLQQTCFACPSQWEALTADEHEQRVYIRYRWGTLSMSLDDINVVMMDHGDGFDGVMDTGTMLRLLKLEEVRV